MHQINSRGLVVIAKSKIVNILWDNFFSLERLLRIIFFPLTYRKILSQSSRRHMARTTQHDMIKYNKQLMLCNVSI